MKTMRMIVHMTSDVAPKTSAFEGVPLGVLSSTNILLKTYRGEVPISPYTIPRALHRPILALARRTSITIHRSLQCALLKRPTSHALSEQRLYAVLAQSTL